MQFWVEPAKVLVPETILNEVLNHIWPAPGSSLALNEAVKLNAEALVKSLIEADANPQLKDGLNETAIECHLDRLGSLPGKSGKEM